MFIYLVRHLPTEYNKKGIYMGRSCDLPILSETIEPFVASTTKIIDPCNIVGSIFYSSPSLRCRQTVKILSGALGISICIDHGSFTCIDVDDKKTTKVRYLNNT
jgi:broad specificity phosphatase PhoE